MPAQPGPLEPCGLLPGACVPQLPTSAVGFGEEPPAVRLARNPAVAVEEFLALPPRGRLPNRDAAALMTAQRDPATVGADRRVTHVPHGPEQEGGLAGVAVQDKSVGERGQGDHVTV